MMLELARKAIHIGFGLAALLLRWLTWQQAAAVAALAFAFNLMVFPRLGAVLLYRGEENQLGWSPGMIAYPLAVLGLVLLCPPPVAAAVWGFMAFGDGVAAVAGSAVGGPALPWNARKTWAGFAGFVAAGSVSATTLYAWCSAGEARETAPACVLTAIVCALFESLPIRLTDNITIPLVGAPVLQCLLAAAVPAEPAAGLREAVAVNLALVAAARAARTLDRSGAAAAFAIGMTVALALGWPGFAVLLAFFVLGSATTRLGRETKRRRGVAQENMGARSARHALANGSVPAFMAFMAAASTGGAAGAFRAAFVASLAAATFDTVSSEIGEWLGSRTYRILSFRPCAAGEDGGVSLEGTLAGFCGAFAVACLAAAVGLVPAGALPWLLLAAAFGGTVDSLLGDSLERRGWLDNEAVNFACTYAGASAGFWIAVLAAR